MTDDKTPTGRDLDKALELEEARLSERVRMRLDSHQDEDTAIIERRATESVMAPAPPSGIPPRGKFILAVLDRLSSTGRAVVVSIALVIGGALFYVSGAAGALVNAFK